MPRAIEAIYENGVLRPLEKLDLGEHQRVQVTLQPVTVAKEDGGENRGKLDPLEGIRSATGIPDLAKHFDDYRFGRREP